MKKHLVLAALLVFSSIACFAQNAPIRPDIGELFTVMRVEQTMNTVMDQMRKAMANSMANSLRNSGSGADAEHMSNVQNKVFDLVQGELAWAKIKPELAQIYADLLTPQETKDLIAFYKSPTGQSFLNKQPELMQRSMALTQGKVMKLTPQIQAIVQSELKAASPAKASPAK